MSENFKTFSTITDAGADIRRQLKARESPVSVLYRINKEDYAESMNDDIKMKILSEAQRHTGVPDEGDYLKRSYDEIKPEKIEFKLVKKTGNYRYFLFSCSPVFKEGTSVQCEKEIRKKIDEIKKELKPDGKSEYEKAKLIYDYICRNVKYDYNPVYDQRKRSAYAALTGEKKTVCSGFALLFYRLALEFDLDARYVRGKSYPGYTDRTHAWNIVRIDGKYYLADTTFDQQDKNARKEYKWFLKGSAALIKEGSHIPAKTQDSDAFRYRYPLSKTDYCQTQDEESGRIDWALEPDGTLKISGNGDMADYTDEHTPPWVHMKITRLEISEGITGVGNMAFCYQTQLESVTFPDSVTRIGEKAFTGCENLKILLPSNAVLIEENAFYGCMAPEELTIPESVREIRSNAFGNISGLKQLTLTHRAEYKSDAFAGCTDLRKIKIQVYPDMVYIKKFVFRGCANLEEVEFYGTKAMASDNDNTRTYAKKSASAFWNRSSVKKIIFAEGITEIAGEAFKNMKHIETAQIASSVKQIGKGAFESSGLREVTLPEGLEEISESAFCCCKSLNRVYIPPTVKKIGIRAFKECAFSEITLPEGLEEIGELAFLRCAKLEKINIPDGIKKIERATFEGCGLREVTLPEELEEIGVRAFYKCSCLENISIPAKTRKIDKLAFRGCGLKEITLPEGLEEISEQAFLRCAKLEKIIIPDSIKKIENSAFEECGLREVTLPEELEEIGVQAFYKCSCLEHISIPAKTRKIDKHAFRDCGLKEITLPRTLEAISIYAFSDCPKLEKVIFSGSCEEWEALKENTGKGNDCLLNAQIEYSC